MSINLELPPLLEISVDSNRITKEKGTGRLNINLNLNKYKLQGARFFHMKNLHSLFIFQFYQLKYSSGEFVPKSDKYGA